MTPVELRQVAQVSKKLNEAVKDFRQSTVVSLEITNLITTKEQLLNILTGYVPTPPKQAALRQLDLNEASSFTDDEVLNFISQNFAKLRVLHLSFCNLITDAGLQHLAALKELQVLHLASCNLITDAGLVSLTALKELEILHLAKCNLITDIGLESLRSLPLHFLSLDRCNGVSNIYRKIFYSHEDLIDAGICVPVEQENKQNVLIPGIVRSLDSSSGQAVTTHISEENKLPIDNPLTPEFKGAGSVAEVVDSRKDPDLQRAINASFTDENGGEVQRISRRETEQKRRENLEVSIEENKENPTTSTTPTNTSEPILEKSETPSASPTNPKIDKQDKSKDKSI